MSDGETCVRHCQAGPHNQVSYTHHAWSDLLELGMTSQSRVRCYLNLHMLLGKRQHALELGGHQWAHTATRQFQEKLRSTPMMRFSHTFSINSSSPCKCVNSHSFRHPVTLNDCVGHVSIAVGLGEYPCGSQLRFNELDMQRVQPQS